MPGSGSDSVDYLKSCGYLRSSFDTPRLFDQLAVFLKTMEGLERWS